MQTVDSWASERPVFILASGQRCGSTLLQRLLNSHFEFLIWGEQHGFLNGFLREYRMLLEWETEYSDHRTKFETLGYDNFLPNMVPNSSAIREAARHFLLELFGTPARAYGRPIWGFKEVRYDASLASFLKRLFPQARFIHLTRNPVDCFISLKHWERAPGAWNRSWTEAMLADWCRINSSFLSLNTTIPDLMSLKYEDMIENPVGITGDICRHLDICAADLDLNVFSRRLHQDGTNGDKARPTINRSDLLPEERLLLKSSQIADVCEALGYQIAFE